MQACPPSPESVSSIIGVGWTCLHGTRSEEHTSELQSRLHLVCRLLLEKKKRYFISIFASFSMSIIFDASVAPVKSDGSLVNGWRFAKQVKERSATENTEDTERKGCWC